MKSTLGMFFMLVTWVSSFGQTHVTMVTGINSTALTNGEPFETQHGGTYAVIGLEAEQVFALGQYSRRSFSVGGGINHLKNGYSERYSLSITNLFSSFNESDLRTSWLHFPLMFRYRYQPFPLVEDWIIFGGTGPALDVRLHSHLYERVDIETYSQESHYRDEGNISAYGDKALLFQQFELGTIYKHMRIAIRFVKSWSDVYHTGLENAWSIPADESPYLEHHFKNGITKERRWELVIGWGI